jgi:hypothetical protein
MIGELHTVVIDCPDIELLARFYEELLGMVRCWTDDDWITIGDSADQPRVSFQLVEQYTPPQWPGQVVPQQMHFDVRVPDLDIGEQKVLELGATETGHHNPEFRVYLDPASHPFCLVL